MKGLYEMPEYEIALNEFNRRQRWSCFSKVHLKKTSSKCPICEVQLDKIDENDEFIPVERPSNRGTTTLIPTIDHYRPQRYYPFLAYNHKNYILMCSDCNNEYKKCNFPLYPEDENNPPPRATTIGELSHEKPLIVNPIIDDPLTLFKLIFQYNPNGTKTLELAPKSKLDSYEQEKAVKTIQLFHLGDCELETTHNVHSFRILIHTHHYEQFYELASAVKRNAVKVLKSILQEKPQLKNYGFFRFIIHKQFEIKTL